MQTLKVTKQPKILFFAWKKKPMYYMHNTNDYCVNSNLKSKPTCSSMLLVIFWPSG